MKTWLFVTLLCITSSSFAKNYYFSSVSGNDSRSASEAQNPSTPWKTLSKLNSIFSTLGPGDNVYLKRGETFYGSIIIKKSGSSGAPITIGAYGSGNRPVITSLVTLSGWASKGGGVWEATNSSLGSTVGIVVINGVQQEMGRYPNSNATNSGYLNFESHSGKTSITDNQLNTSTNWTGAQIVIRERHWIIDKGTITGQSGKKLTYKTDSKYEPYPDYGYFIQNSVKTLDKTGEWYYNPSSKKLSVYNGSGSPSNVQVATTTGDLVSSSNYSYVTLDNLTIRGSNGNGVFINNGSNIHIQNCDILFSGVAGAIVHGHTGLHIENCNISNSNNAGIDMEYGVKNAVIKNNKIINTATFPGLIQNGDGTGLAVYSNGEGADIENNEIRNTGFIGLTFYGSNVTIKNNLIDKFCYIKDDGGALYTHGESKTVTNRKLINNIIMNGTGAGPGTDRPTKVSVNGIYLDADAVNVEITGNTVTNCYHGIFLQSTQGVTVKGNTFYDNSNQMSILRRAGHKQPKNNNLTQNNCFAKDKDQHTLYAMTSAGSSDLSTFGTFDYNYYARPVDDGQSIFTSYISGGKMVNAEVDLATWQKKYGKDAHTKKSPMQLSSKTAAAVDQSISFQYNASGSAKTISLNGGAYVDVTGKKYSGSIVLQPYTSAVLIKTGGSGNINEPPSVDIVSPDANESFSAGANVNITATAKDNDGKISKVEFYNGNTLLGSDNSSPYSYSWNKVAAGNYVLTAVAIDDKGSSSVSLPVSISVGSVVTPPPVDGGGGGGSDAPVVNITDPVNNANFAKGATITLTATATDDGKVTQVQFYNGSTLLNTQKSAPYTYSWKNVADGNYSITAKATDDDGNATVSSAVSITVGSQGTGGGNKAPTVTMVIPATDTTYSRPSDVYLLATAADADGSISKVEFFNGNTLLKVERGVPYRYNWQDVPAGTYTVTAKATDNDGAVTISAPVKIVVKSQALARGSSSASTPVAAANPNEAVSIAPNEGAVMESGKLLSQASNLVDFRLIPNPAVNTVQIYFEGLQANKKANLTITNALGEVVKKYPVIISGKKIDMDVSSLRPGIYFIDLSGDNFKVNKKFSKIN